MPTHTAEQRTAVQNHLQQLAGTSDLFAAGNAFFGKALGYDTSREGDLEEGTYAEFRELYVADDPMFQDDNALLKWEEKALAKEWRGVRLLFQLTETEMSRGVSLFDTGKVDNTVMESYLFVAIDLTGEAYSRTKLAAVTREVNKLFRQPVLLLFRYGTEARQLLTLAVIDRRLNRRDREKDVLQKITFVKDIDAAKPNRAHVDILTDLHRDHIRYRDKKGKELPPRNFVQLHQAWRDVLNVSELNKRFYKELSDWFFWATGKDETTYAGVDFQFAKLPPPEAGQTAKDQLDAARSRAVIRLITRIIFIWFLKEKGLVPDSLFDRAKVKENFALDEDESAYYKAVLQNLFFAVLNTPIDKRDVVPEAYRGNTGQMGNKSLLRYLPLCTCDRAQMRELFHTIPFLNGGLFECLDTDDQLIDCFSDRAGKQPTVPNQLFFREEELEVDLDHIYKTRGKHTVRGLFPILRSYKFTIDENTPVDEEVALDPELLGKVFENLLASYNEETKDTARRQTGSFYTPREIVNYMVEEGLIAYLEDYIHRRIRPKRTDPKFQPVQMGLFGLTPAIQTEFDFDDKNSAGDYRKELRTRLRQMVSLNQTVNPFADPAEVRFVVEAIDAIRILDPAVGSGAYPMGALQLLVHVLAKIDPDNTHWKAVQQQKEAEGARPQVQGEDVEAVFKKQAEKNYFRKLYLIQNCIFGVDLQPIAIQICKLRFFISLAVEERRNDDPTDNYGAKPLPNLETKFVAANTLIGLTETIAKRTRKDKGLAVELPNVRLEDLKQELKALRRRSFSVKTRAAKQKLRDRDEEVRNEIRGLLKDDGFAANDANALADWNPYDQSQSAPYFEPDWMLGQADFSLVIGNPPYRQIQKYGKDIKAAWKEQGYKTYVPTGDIYSLFYERGVELLAERGILAYITSNNWMRAKYGEATRKFFATQNPLTLVDFGMAQMFESATTYTNILILQKGKNERETRMVRVKDDFDAGKEILPDYVAANASLQDALGGDSWVAYTETEYRLKRRVETADRVLPLKDWDIQINYGIKTGYNDAFIIPKSKRDELVKSDPNSAEIIRPILRGRDVRPWVPAWEEWYLINTHNGIKAKNIPPIDVENDYPAIFEWFKSHEKKMAKRYDKGDHWTNLRNLAYLEEFDRPKLLYPDITNSMPFMLDMSGTYVANNLVYMMTGEHLEYLCCIFNSTLFRGVFKNSFPEVMGNSSRLQTEFFDKIKIKQPDPATEWVFDRLADYILRAKTEDAAPAAGLFFQQLVNGLVYELYFAEALGKQGIRFMPLLTEDVLPELAEGEAGLATLQKVYATLHDKRHPVRIGLFKLDTVREVRVIEGKDK